MTTIRQRIEQAMNAHQKTLHTNYVAAPLGVLVAAGFLAASGAANWLFAYGLAPTPALAFTYGCIGILATLANAYIPIRLLQALDARRGSIIIASLILFPICAAFSLASAFGFAASMRNLGTADQTALSANYETRTKELSELEAVPLAKRTKHQTNRLTTLRSEVIAYRNKGAMKTADAQAEALAALGIPNGRYVVSLLFALFIEIGACVSAFLAFSTLQK